MMNEPLKQLENHPQYSRAQADCFEILPVIPSGSVDLILTDPPYGVTNCSWDVKPDIPRFFEEAWRVLKFNGALVVFGTFRSSIDWFLADPSNFRYNLVWVKNSATGFLDSKKKPLKSHELILVFYRKLPTYNPQMVTGKAYSRYRAGGCSPIYGKRGNVTTRSNGDRYPKDVLKVKDERLRFAGGGKRTTHTSQKPLALCEWFIKTYTNPGQTVLDPFMGSGSTGVACINLGRKFIGIEKDVHFFEVADKRIQAAIDNYQHKLPFFDD